MGRQIPRRRHRDLPDPAQVQVRRANIRMVQDRLDIGKRINIINKCESQLANIRFIPLAAYEKGLSADGLAVLSKDGKTTGGQKINIRKKADSKSKIVTKKNVGTYVTITREEGDYYLITVDKKTGYVHKDFITVITEPAE